LTITSGRLGSSTAAILWAVASVVVSPRPSAVPWRRRAAGVDRATLADFLAFDGDLASVTDRMMAAFVRVVSAVN
jgi:hypothetical protein